MQSESGKERVHIQDALRRSRTDLAELKGLVRDWTLEALTEMSPWVAEIVEEDDHPLVVDLETIHNHARKMGPWFNMVGQTVAHIRAEEERAEARSERAFSRAVARRREGGLSITEAKTDALSDLAYIRAKAEEIEVRCQRRCMEAFQRALSAKENSMPGSFGSANIAARRGW